MGVEDRSPNHRTNRPVRPPEPLKEFLRRLRLEGLYHHCRLARFLSGAGFDIRSIQRKAYHDIWVVHMRRGLVPSGREVETAKCYVQRFLRRQGVRYLKREIDVSTRGERLLVLFFWKAGRPGCLTYWGGNLRVKGSGNR